MPLNKCRDNFNFKNRNITHRVWCWPMNIFAGAKYPIGVCYGMLGNNLPAPVDVINLFRQYGIERIRIYDPNTDVLVGLNFPSIWHAWGSHWTWQICMCQSGCSVSLVFHYTSRDSWDWYYRLANMRLTFHFSLDYKLKLRKLFRFIFYLKLSVI